MKKIILSMISVLTMGIAAQAQQAWMVDSAQMGTGPNTYDHLYSMTNGLQHSEPARNWHLAFALSPIGDSAGVWANHQSGNSFVKVYNVHKDSTQWSTVTLADTATATMCYNNDQGWHQGALNAIPSADPYNFGWGHYDYAVTHNIVGDSIFIVKANGVFYKLFIQVLNPFTTTYTFSVENLSVPAPAVVYNVSKGTKYANRNFAYFDLATGVDTNRESANTDWDIIFNRYTTDVVGSGQFTNNNVLGVLQNHGVTVAKAMTVHVDSAYVNYLTYVPNVSPIINKIGYDWKSFNMTTFGYDVPDSVSYFIYDKSANLWQMQFLSYTSSTGTIVFRKRMLFPLAIADVNSNINKMSVYPNPAQQNMNVVLETKNASYAHLFITDITGKTVATTSLNLTSGLNALNIPCGHLPNGNYILSIKGDNMNINEKITIAK